MTGRDSSRVLVAASLVALYLIWGSTYLAIRIALEGFPPLLMAALRHLSAGAILFAVLKLRGAPWPTRRQWRGALVTGALLLAGGNGGVSLSERSVASSFAAIVVASMPLWVAVIGLRYGHRTTRREIGGLLVGFAGVVILNLGNPISGDPIAFIAIIASPILWAWGSILSGRLELPRGPMASAAQMLCGGAVLVVVGLAGGERLTVIASPRPVLAVGYLIALGSLVAFSAYGYLLRTVRSTVATSYAYVNPLVAIALGVLFAHEDLSARGIVATALTLGGVFVLVSNPPG